MCHCRSKRSRSLATSHTYPEVLQAYKAKEARTSGSRGFVEELILTEDHPSASARSRKSIAQQASLELHAAPTLVSELASTSEACQCQLSVSPAVITQPLHHHANGFHSNGHRTNGHHVNGHVYITTDTITIGQPPPWETLEAAEAAHPELLPAHEAAESVSYTSQVDIELGAGDGSASARFIPNPSTSGRDEPAHFPSHLYTNGRASRHKAQVKGQLQTSVLTEVHGSEHGHGGLGTGGPASSPPQHSQGGHHHLNGSTASVLEPLEHQQTQALKEEHAFRNTAQQKQHRLSTHWQQQQDQQQHLHSVQQQGSHTYSVLLPPKVAELAKTRLEQVLAVDPMSPGSMDSFPLLLQLLQSNHIHPWDAPRAADWLASHGRYCTVGMPPLGLSRACLLAQAFALVGIRDTHVLQEVERVTCPLLSQHTIKMVTMLVLAFDKLEYMPSMEWQNSALTALYLMLRPMQPKLLGPVVTAVKHWQVKPDEAWLAELLTVSKDKVVKMKPSCCMQLLSALTRWGARVDSWWMKMFVHHTKDKLYGLNSRELADIIHLVVLHHAVVPEKWYRCFQKYALVQLRNWDGRDCVRVLSAMSCVHQPVRTKLLVDLLQRATEDCDELTAEERIQGSHAALSLGVKTQHFNRTAGVRATLLTRLPQLGASSCAHALVLVDELAYKMPGKWFDAYLTHTAGQLRHMSAREIAVVANRLVKLKVPCPVEWRRLFVRHMSSHMGAMTPQELCMAVAAMGCFISEGETEEVAKFSSAVMLSVRAFSPACAAQVVRVLSGKGLHECPPWVVTLVQQVKAAFVEQHGSSGRASRVKRSS